jgi:N-acetylglucosaminyl-diphospho-decaprenol L-rhamnosyltransferase
MNHRNDAGFSEGGPNLLIVIVCYRVVELTIKCLHSIASQIQDVPGARVFVCENGTGPESVEQLRQCILANGWQPWVTLQAIEPNVGFTGGNNAVLREVIRSPSWPRYFLLLNADTELQPGALKSLYEAAERSPEVGVMGALMMGPGGQPQISCFRDHSPVSEFLRGAGSGIINRIFLRGPFQLAPPTGVTHYDWVSFACAMIRSDVVREVGILDEGFFLYYDDADYCRTARKAGWKIGCCKSARVVHFEGQSNELPAKALRRERKPRYYYVSRSRYFAKHIGAAGLWAANFAWTAGSVFAAIHRLISNRPGQACVGEWKDIWTNAWAPVRYSDASLSPKESRIIV